MIIALMGPAGSGKSAVASYLERQHGALRYSFAYPLKEMVRRALDFTRAQVYGTQAEKEAIDPRYGHSPRWFLQRIGTEGCRAVFGDQFWIEQCIAKIRRETAEIAVIDDARFVNEAEAVIAAGGHVWRLEAPARSTEADASHPSESGWLDAPYTDVIRPEAMGLDLLYTLTSEALDRALQSGRPRVRTVERLLDAGALEASASFVRGEDANDQPGRH